MPRAALACAARSVAQLAVPGKAIDGLKVPALVMVGSKDPLQEGARELARRVRGAKLRVVEGATHLTLLGAPRLVPEVQGFVAAHAGR